MEEFVKDIEKKENCMKKAVEYLLKEIYIQAIEIMEKWKALGVWNLHQKLYMMEDGLMINKKDSVLKYDLMDQNLKDIIKMASSLVKENSFARIKQGMKETLLVMYLKDMENIFGLIENMKDSEKMEKCMEKGILNGMMENFMKEIMLWILRKDMEYLNGLMGENMKDIGKMGSNMVKVY